MREDMTMSSIPGEAHGSQSGATSLLQRGACYGRESAQQLTGVNPHFLNRQFDNTLAYFQLDDNRLGAFFLVTPGSEESGFVKNQIMKYVGWLRRNVQPTDSEVNMEFVDP